MKARRRVRTNKKKGKKIMVALFVLAVVAIMIAQAVNVGHKIDLR